jgi:hypothetical protein
MVPGAPHSDSGQRPLCLPKMDLHTEFSPKKHFAGHML